MGALPKNKITSVERGKRRKGNTPKLRKDTKSRQPLHKRGFVAELLQFIGVTSSAQPTADKTTTTTATKAKKADTTKKESATPAVAGVSAAPAQARKSATRGTKAQPTAKTTRKAQHKG